MYTNKQKDEMLNKVMNVMEEFGCTNVRSDGQYATSDQGVLNVFDYMDDYEGLNKKELKAYCKSLLQEEEESIKSQYRKTISHLNQYVNMTGLLTDMGINSSNYFAFMNGDDTRLSAEKLDTIIFTLSSRPITIKKD